MTKLTDKNNNVVKNVDGEMNNDFSLEKGREKYSQSSICDNVCVVESAYYKDKFHRLFSAKRKYPWRNSVSPTKLCQTLLVDTARGYAKF